MSFKAGVGHCVFTCGALGQLRFKFSVVKASNTEVPGYAESNLSCTNHRDTEFPPKHPQCSNLSNGVIASKAALTERCAAHAKWVQPTE